MDQQRVRVRNNRFYCQKWALFSFSLITLIGSLVLAVMSEQIIELYFRTHNIERNAENIYGKVSFLF